MSCPACESTNISSLRTGGWKCLRCYSKWFPKDEVPPPMEAKVLTTEKILKDPTMKRLRAAEMKNRRHFTTDQIKELLNKGLSQADVAEMLDVPRTVILKMVREIAAAEAAEKESKLRGLS